MARLKAIPVPLARHVHFHGDVMRFHGDPRLKRMFPMRDFIDAGLRSPGSSDFGAGPSDPAPWPRRWVTRAHPGVHVRGENRRITVEEANGRGAIHGAQASFEEGPKGRLERGKPAESLTDARARRTMMGGRWVFEA
jgi:predicted amidohydrolase YtcJ